MDLTKAQYQTRCHSNISNKNSVTKTYKKIMTQELITEFSAKSHPSRGSVLDRKKLHLYKGFSNYSELS